MSEISRTRSHRKKCMTYLASMAPSDRSGGETLQKPEELHLLYTKTFLMQRMPVIICQVSMYVTDIWLYCITKPIRHLRRWMPRRKRQISRKWKKSTISTLLGED